jgi:hypothetical protein
MTTHLSAKSPTRREGHSFRLATIAAVLAVMFTPIAQAQAPAATANVAAAQNPAELEKLVDRIALYPDDLVTIILPASTSPLQIVQADRYLEKRKKDPKAPLDDKWDDPVKSLLNYPEVVKMMSNDLDWTSALGEAVVVDQGAVLEAVQAFRRKTQAAGNLKSDSKQVVVVEKEIIKIVPADPQVIYVPQYNPSTVVVYGGYSSWGYYPAPYPVYYYPYPPGAALATGLIWGAAIGAAWSGNRYGWGGDNDININRTTNISGGDRTTNVGGGANRPSGGAGERPGGGSGAGAGRPGQQPAGGGSSKWQSGKKPGQVSSSVGKTPSSGGRVGNTGASAGGGLGGGAGGGVGGGSRPSTQPAGGGRDFGGGSHSGGGAFGGSSSSGRQTQMDSSRGASSRSSMSGGGGGRSGASAGSYGGGGARASGGGGGGARAGGGGGGGRGGGGGGGGRGGGGRR